jgi:hypothetical protein
MDSVVGVNKKSTSYLNERTPPLEGGIENFWRNEIGNKLVVLL